MRVASFLLGSSLVGLVGLVLPLTNGCSTPSGEATTPGDTISAPDGEAEASSASMPIADAGSGSETGKPVGDPTGGDAAPGADGGADGSITSAPDAAGGKRVFLTSGHSNGDLKTAGSGTDGPSGADHLCQAAAAAAALGGTWTAFVSASAAGSTIDAPDRITGNGPWFLINGVLAFATKASLSGDNPSAPIDVTETGQKLGGGAAVWTGTKAGAYQGPTCQLAGKSWETAATSPSGVIGDTGNGFGEWSDRTTRSCADTTGHLYCFED